MQYFRWRIGVLAVALLALQAADGFGEPESKTNPAALEHFEKKVRPILVGHCSACHSAETNPKGDLRVDDRNGLLTGGKTGPAVVPGDPEKSLLLRRVTQPGNRRMPLEGEHLSPEEIAELTKWIKDGAAWPAVKVPSSLGKSKAEYEKLKKEHWAWQPLGNPKVPAVKDTAWPKDDVDRFVLAKLEAANLKPVAEVDGTTLIRRLTFDLTGLPPTPAEIDAFLKDQDVAQAADRLLASPQFGERWGRHWLDVARFGESTGPSRNIPYPHAWKYRDYVIDSVNADIPFDRFIKEQIAGDLLPADSDAERNRLATATGFLALGVKDVNQRFKVRFIMDNVDEQIDAVSRSILGLTVSCARCHDHKFDPVPTSDYYALAGIFTSTENCAGVRNKMGGGGLDYYDPANLVTLKGDLPSVPSEELERRKAELAAAKKAWDEIRGTPKGLAKAANGQPTQRPFRLKYEKLQAEWDAMADPAQRGFAVHGVRDAKTVGDTEIRIRGEAEKLGPIAPRGFLTALDVPGAPKIDPTHSGRLELAEWLASPKNPLTSRVIVNRVWEHLFGRGIVSTVDNFGVMGDAPTHPELLDYLANRFIQDGYSVKKLIRALVLTRAYQLGSESTEVHRTADPANKLVWRHSPRRLDAEEIRDALLAASGRLDVKRPGPSPAKELRMVEMRDNGPEAKTINEKADASRHRSVYLPLLRGVTPHALEAFDPVEQTLVTGSREVTTVPGQALFLLNSAFVQKYALALAENLAKSKEAGEAERIETAYRLALGRKPNERETERVRGFLAEYASAWREQPGAPETPKPQPKAEKPKPAAEVANPDEVDQTGEAVVEERVIARNATEAAWMAFVQSLFGSAEFRYLR